MNDAISSGGTDARALAMRTHLDRIADTLGCPVAAFYTGEGLPADLVAQDKLLSLWGALKTDASRQAVLKLVRAIVENE